MTPAFRDIVRRDHDRVHSYAAWMLGDVDAARDIAQEAFLRLWEHHERIAPGAARTWLLTTAHRLIIDRSRRRTARTVDSTTVPAVSTGHGPYDRAARGEMQGIVTDALAHLSARERGLLLLREQHRLSLADIGRVMDMPVGSVKAALHRARRRLCELLPAEDVDPEPDRLPTEVLA